MSKSGCNKKALYKNQSSMEMTSIGNEIWTTVIMIAKMAKPNVFVMYMCFRISICLNSWIQIMNEIKRIVNSFLFHYKPTSLDSVCYVIFSHISKYVEKYFDSIFMKLEIQSYLIWEYSILINKYTDFYTCFQ